MCFGSSMILRISDERRGLSSGGSSFWILWELVSSAVQGDTKTQG